MPGKESSQIGISIFKAPTSVTEHAVSVVLLPRAIQADTNVEVMANQIIGNRRSQQEAVRRNTEFNRYCRVRTCKGDDLLQKFKRKQRFTPVERYQRLLSRIDPQQGFHARHVVPNRSKGGITQKSSRIVRVRKGI